VREIRKSLIKENRIYIMPSGRGFLFLAMIVVLILTAATYNNNLIFILAFFLFSIFIVSMLQTHYNLKGVRLIYVGCEDAFQDDSMSLLFHLEQKRARHKKAIRVRSNHRRFSTLKGAYEELRPHETTRAARVEILAAKRGRHPVPEMIVETFYPLGIFRAWKVFRPEGEMTVYPRPEAGQPLEATVFDLGESELGVRSTPDGDFGELKNYLPGESYHQIAWKHYARTGSLYTKVHWGSEHKHYVIPWSPPAAKSQFEKYLMHLSGCVKQASEENASFELETPDTKIEPGTGAEHARQCWRALAVIEEAK
jgi:uncharacterized protein (DUF58 family)